MFSLRITKSFTVGVPQSPRPTTTAAQRLQLVAHPPRWAQPSHKGASHAHVQG